MASSSGKRGISLGKSRQLLTPLQLLQKPARPPADRTRRPICTIGAVTRTVVAIVDDEADIRMLIRAALRRDPRIGVQGEATSADEAVELAKVLQPAVVILDHDLDGNVTGLEAAPGIKAASPASKVLLFTAYDMAADAAASPSVDAYLRKDRVADLVRTVQGLLGLDAVSP